MIVYNFLALTLLALIAGLVFMAIGGKTDEKYSTGFMALRVALQLGVIVCLYLLYANS